jgi:hypothetical protein
MEIPSLGSLLEKLQPPDLPDTSAEPRDGSLPLLVWTIRDLDVGQSGARDILRELHHRGMGMIISWQPGSADQDGNLEKGLALARLQKELGHPVIVDATHCMHLFCDGSPETAHLSAKGERYFDLSHLPSRHIGCPFALHHRYPFIKRRFLRFLDAYAMAQITVDMIFLDWEIDGPLEWNGAWEASKGCRKCRANIPNIENFADFQAALRRIRGIMQREVYTKTVKRYFPEVLIGNYAVYPHDGFRYWYDFYEKPVEGGSYKAPGDTRYRKWFDEFSLTGYSMAMPVVYPWPELPEWYRSGTGGVSEDYRWFHGMLKVATNACRSSRKRVPLVCFVHWQPIRTRNRQPPGGPMSRWAYEELLWHLLLRGADTLFLWCEEADTLKEMEPVYRVYAASRRYQAFFSQGRPTLFHVPGDPGAVVSCIRMGDKLLLKRTDFLPDLGPMSVNLPAGEAQTPKSVEIPPGSGECLIISVG